VPCSCGPPPPENWFLERAAEDDAMTIWKQSWKDSFLVGLAALQTLLFVVAFVLHRQEAGAIQWGVALLLIFLICTNFQCVAHNFLHLPFFTSRWMNRAFSVWNSLLLGVPQTLYKHHHLNHHRFNSDYKGPDGTTRDFSSIYRYSNHPERAESFIRYALLGPFRVPMTSLYKAALAHGEGRQLQAELAVVGVCVTALAWTSPAFTLFVYLPVWYLGQAAAQAENYLEHFGARPGDRKTDAVSCYSRWYNWIWFNNGYHQEHHWRPQVHWSEVPRLTDTLPGADRRRVVRYTHWINWPLLTSFSRSRSE
jgi:fatty acid desaturase